MSKGRAIGWRDHPDAPARWDLSTPGRSPSGHPFWTTVAPTLPARRTGALLLGCHSFHRRNPPGSH